METLLIKTKGEKLKALKAFLSSLNIPFQTVAEEESRVPSKEMVQKIEKAHKEHLKGETIKVDPKNVWESI